MLKAGSETKLNYYQQLKPVKARSHFGLSASIGCVGSVCLIFLSKCCFVNGDWEDFFFSFCEKVPCDVINTTGLFTTSYYFRKLKNIGASQQR